MVALQKMNEEEFRAFMEFSVSDYAADLMKGRDISPEQALKEAKEEFDEDLPGGLETKDSFVMNIADANKNRVGWIWFYYFTDEESDKKQAFLADLLVFESERRKGFASAAIKMMNTLAKKDGCSSSLLIVWDHNPGGMSLYEKCDYKPYRRERGGTYMVKEL